MNELREKWIELCKKSGINPKDGSRCLEIVMLRYIYYHWARENTPYRLTDIGWAINRNHSSVIYGLKKYNTYIETNDPILLRILNKINKPKIYHNMKPEIKNKLGKALQEAFDQSENSAERKKIYQIGSELGIKIQYLHDNFAGLQNILP
jgi:hypothetical protein